MQPARRLHLQLGAAVAQSCERRHLVQAHAQLQGHAPQAPGQLGRVHGAAALARPHRPGEQRRADLLGQLSAVQPLDLMAVAAMQFVVVTQRGEVFLVDRHGHLAVPLDVGIDAVARQRGLEAIEVVAAEGFELLDVLGKHAHRIGQAMHDGRGNDAAGTARGAVRDPPGLDQQHVQIRVLLLGLDSRPQAGEAAADNQQIGARVLLQRLGGRRRVGAVEPIRHQPRGAERVAQVVPICRLPGEGRVCLDRAGHGAWRGGVRDSDRIQQHVKLLGVLQRFPAPGKAGRQAVGVAGAELDAAALQIRQGDMALGQPDDLVGAGGREVDGANTPLPPAHREAAGLALRGAPVLLVHAVVQHRVRAHAGAQARDVANHLLMFNSPSRGMKSEAQLGAANTAWRSSW